MAVSPRNPLPPWVSVALFGVVLAVAWWQTSPPPRVEAPTGSVPTRAGRTVTDTPSDPPIDVEVSGESETSSDSAQNPSTGPLSSETRPEIREEQRRSSTGRPRAVEPGDRPTAVKTPATTRIENQEIRDQSGRIAYRGPIDLQPTLDRIRRGERNSHRNDGTTFQNRERRLPVQPAGYYREYVHPTEGLSGPGPQRVIVGRGGEVWYTADHYRTFRRIE